MPKIKRIYEDAEASDGVRFLVERLWPRGMKKEELFRDRLMEREDLPNRFWIDAGGTNGTVGGHFYFEGARLTWHLR